MQSCVSKPVVADRIKWKLAPSFDPLPYLSDPVVREAYKNPDCLRRPKSQWPSLPKAVVHAGRDQVLLLAEKWDKLGACAVACSAVKPVETVGMFAVPKDADWGKLILNPTVINSRPYPYSVFTKTLAPGYLMCQIQLADSERLLISSDDLCEFYYTFKVSLNRSKRNAIGVKFAGHELRHLECFPAALLREDCYLCLGTLAMGDALAVEVAQQSHYNLLQKLAGCMLPQETLQYRKPCPRGPVFELLTIDDHIGLQRVPRGSTSFAGTRDVEVFAAAEQAYKEVKLTAHPGKRQRQEVHATVLGAEVHGERGRVSAPRARVAVLCYITSIIVYKGLTTRKILQGLLGCWTHICLFRRPVFSTLDRVYHEGENLPGDVPFKMSRQCCNELLLLCLLAPTMQTDLRAEPCDALYMMDASPVAGGICKAAFSRTGVAELWRHTEQRGFYTKLQQGPGKVLRELGLEREEIFGPGDLEWDYHTPAKAFQLHAELKDRTTAFDCIELFAGQGNWSAAHEAAGLKVHPGVERDAVGAKYGDLSNNDTFHVLAKLAYGGAVKDWRAGPPCWSFGTLRRPRLRSKSEPAGFNPNDPQTREQTLLAVRTAFLLRFQVAATFPVNNLVAL